GGRFAGISRFSGDQVRDAGLVRGQMPVSPGRGSFRFSDRTATVVPRESSNAQFFSRGGRTAGSASPSPNRHAFENTRPPSGGGGPSPRNGWQRFGEPSRPSVQNTRPAETPQQPNRGSWQRFGEPSRSFQNTRPAERPTPNPPSRGGWER